MIAKASFSTLFVLLLASTCANAQVEANSQLISGLLVGRGTFVIVKPINPQIFKDHWLTPDDTVSHADDHYGFRAFKETGISVKSLAEMIANSRKVDTTLWTMQELGSVVLINQRESFLKPKEVLTALGISDKAESNSSYRKSIRRFNNTNPKDRYIYRLSRPAFDNAGLYAAVLEDFGASGMSGGGVLAIFERKEDGWHRVGTPKRWAY